MSSLFRLMPCASPDYCQIVLPLLDAASPLSLCQGFFGTNAKVACATGALSCADHLVHWQGPSLGQRKEEGLPRGGEMIGL